MKKLIVLCLLCMLPSMAHAEDLNKRENVEKLLVLLNADSIIDNIYLQVHQMMQGMARELGVKPSERELFDKYTAKIIDVMKSEMNWKKMKEPMTNLYLKHYSDKEIRDMVSFYKSESGQSMIKKMPEVMQDSMLISQGMMKGFIPKMQAMTEELRHEIDQARNARQ